MSTFAGITGRALSAGLAAIVVMAAAPAGAMDWGSVPGKQITLFYPGQASWEWALTQSDHSGNKKFRGGKNCKECHAGEEKKIGDLIVSGEKLEPEPPAGKPGALEAEVKMAHDGERLYVRVQWTGAEPSGDKPDPDHQSKVTMMFDDGHVAAAARAGCWGTCHADAVDMPHDPAGEEITKYLAVSRTKMTREGGGTNYKPQGELDSLIESGEFMEYWQAGLNPGQPAEPVSGYILDKRHEDGSPVVSAEADYADGTWTVVLSRALKAPGPTHKDIAPGKTYSLGFAIHDDYAAHRHHHVTFEQTMVLNEGDADFVAVKK